MLVSIEFCKRVVTKTDFELAILVFFTDHLPLKIENVQGRQFWR